MSTAADPFAKSVPCPVGGWVHFRLLQAKPRARERLPAVDAQVAAACATRDLHRNDVGQRVALVVAPLKGLLLRGPRLPGIPRLLAQLCRWEQAMLHIEHHELELRAVLYHTRQLRAQIDCRQKIIPTFLQAVLGHPLAPSDAPAPGKPLGSFRHVGHIRRTAAIAREDVEAVGGGIVGHRPVMPAAIVEFVVEVAKAERRDAACHIGRLALGKVVGHLRRVGLRGLAKDRRPVIQRHAAQLFDRE